MTKNKIANNSSSECLGTIDQIRSSFVTIRLNENNLNHSVAIGDFLIIPDYQFHLFGQVVDIDSKDRSLHANVKLLVSINQDTKEVSKGVAGKPQINSQVFKAPPEVIKLVTKPKKSDGATTSLLLDLARLDDESNLPLSFTPETLFGRHCAIFGTTGSGKSWTIAKLLEEAANYKSKMILFDATGEFYTLNKKVTHVQLGKSLEESHADIEVAMPYQQLTENDLFAIFNPKGQSQALKLRTAIKTLKLLRLEPDLTIDGTFIKANKEKNNFNSAYMRRSAELEKPSADFDIEYLSRQIANECVKPIRSASETGFWGEKSNLEHSECIPLISRVEELIHSETLAPIFKPSGKESILKTVQEFLADDKKSILRISLENLSFEHSSREIIANAIGRFLLNLGRASFFKNKPVFLIVDEAHQFINNKVNDETETYSLDSFAIIAKEGRKFGINIGIVTQRPKDIPEGVLSQFGTFIVHRLINDHDLRVVERASGQFDNKTMDSIPLLSPGEAVLLGAAFPFPMKVIFNQPDSKPDSSGPDYQKNWL